MKNKKKLKILFVIAHEIFRDEEYRIPREILESNGFSVVVASSDKKPATGKYGMKVDVDLLLEETGAKDFKAVVFVGGSGCKQYWNDTRAHSLAKEFYEAGKLTTAICSAPVILANAGILNGKNATCFPDDKQHLLKNGANYINEEVVLDGNIITGRDYNASEKFGLTILGNL